MTKFITYFSTNGKFYVSYMLDTRFRPEMLTSLEKETEVDCYKLTEQLKLNIQADRLLSFECSRSGFRFFVHATSGNKIA